MRRAAAVALLFSCSAPPPAPPGVEAVGRVELGTLLGGLVRSPGTDALFVVDLTNRELLRIRARSAEVTARAELGRPVCILAGETEVVAVLAAEENAARVVRFSAEDLALAGHFKVGVKPASACLDTRGRLYIASSDPPPRVVVLDPRQRKLLHVWPAPSPGSFVAMAGGRLAVSSRGRQPGLLRMFDPGDSGAFRDIELAGAGGGFFVAGERLLFPSGAAVAPATGELRPMDPFLCAASDGGWTVLALADGRLRIYDAAGSLRGEPRCPWWLAEIVFDRGRGLVYAIAGRPESVTLVDGVPRVEGDILWIDVSRWLE